MSYLQAFTDTVDFPTALMNLVFRNGGEIAKHADGNVSYDHGSANVCVDPRSAEIHIMLNTGIRTKDMKVAFDGLLEDGKLLPVVIKRSVNTGWDLVTSTPELKNLVLSLVGAQSDYLNDSELAELLEFTKLPNVFRQKNILNTIDDARRHLDNHKCGVELTRTFVKTLRPFEGVFVTKNVLDRYVGVVSKTGSMAI